MELFRIATEEHSHKLTSSGAENRWNNKGELVIYSSLSRSLSTLEVVVHRASIKPKVNYRVMILSLPDDDRLIKTIISTELPSNWRSLYAYSSLQSIGSLWYQAMDFLILKVPSAVIPAEHNYILNTEHKDFKRSVKLIRTEDYFWDERLL